MSAVRPLSGALIGLLCAGALALPGCVAPDRVSHEEPPHGDTPPREECLTRECHRGVAAEPQVHRPVEEQPCVFCHRPLGGDHPEGLGMEFESILGKNKNFCVDCHFELEPRPAYIHRPYGLRQCRECHEVHGSPIRPLMKRDVSGLCSYCHRDVAIRIENCRVVHGALTEGTCVDTCHDPHESEIPGLLRTGIDGLCLQCHDGDGATPSHPPAAEGRCLQCHFPHAANKPALLRDGVSP